MPPRTYRVRPTVTPWPACLREAIYERHVTVVGFVHAINADGPVVSLSHVKNMLGNAEYGVSLDVASRIAEFLGKPVSPMFTWPNGDLITTTDGEEIR